MRIKANDYSPAEIIKIIREWSGLTQEGFGKMLGRSRHSIQSMELGRKNVFLHTLLEIADKQGLSITIEKKSKTL